MTEQALWTIMVYMSGDSVLDNFAIESLKKLRDGAGHGVTVEFLFDPNQKNVPERANRYDGTPHMNASLFKELGNEKTASQKSAPIPVNIAASKTLEHFIKTAIHRADSATGANDENRHYGLILWGHGPELLFDAVQPPKRKSGAGPDRQYLTPARLGLALKEANLPVRPKVGLTPGEKVTGSPRKLDFIAFDACSMGMVEVAAELQECAELMIASQDDVPDQSFPYDQILPLFRNKGNAKEACTQIPQEYKNAFRDYFPSPGPAVTNITLSCLNLQNIDKFTGLLQELSNELRRLARTSAAARKAIIHARTASRDFVLGLYVDIYEFCQNLQAEKDLDVGLNTICDKICSALREKGDLVLDNQTNEQEGVRCHGLSIYLPYLSTKEGKQIEESLTLTTGGTGVGNQMSQTSKGGSPTNLHKSRIARIAETEKDLASLTRFKEWSNFIKCTWSYILKEEETSVELDLHYSAKQCRLNLSSCEVPSKSSGAAA